MPDICRASGIWAAALDAISDDGGQRRTSRARGCRRQRKAAPARASACRRKPAPTSFRQFMRRFRPTASCRSACRRPRPASFAVPQRAASVGPTTGPRPAGPRVSTSRASRRALRAGQRTAQPGLQLALDQLAVAGLGIELPHQRHRAGAQASRHLVEVLRRHLAHGAIELELLDRSQHQHLLAFEHRAHRFAQRAGRRRLFLADEWRKRPVQSRAREAGRADGQADQHQVLGRASRARTTAIVAARSDSSRKKCHGCSVSSLDRARDDPELVEGPLSAAGFGADAPRRCR